MNVKVIKFNVISNAGRDYHECLLQKDENEIRNCVQKFFENNKKSKVVVFGTQCSGKSTFWREYNPSTDEKYLHDTDDEDLHMRQRLSEFFISTNNTKYVQMLGENDVLVKTSRKIDNLVDCMVKEREILDRDWYVDMIKQNIKPGESLIDGVKTDLLKEQKKINDGLNKMIEFELTNIIETEWIE